MSMRIVPEAGHASSLSSTRSTDALATVGVHDSLRHGVLSHASSVNDRHPLAGRLSSWNSTQAATRLESMRRIYGLGEPLRRGMELHCASLGWRPAVMGPPVGLDVLRGTDTTLSVEDIYPNTAAHPATSAAAATGRGAMMAGANEAVGTFHDEMERGLRHARQF